MWWGKMWVSSLDLPPPHGWEGGLYFFNTYLTTWFRSGPGLSRNQGDPRSCPQEAFKVWIQFTVDQGEVSTTAGNYARFQGKGTIHPWNPGPVSVSRHVPYNSHIIKLTIQKYTINSVDCSIFTCLSHHCHYLITEHFYYIKKKCHFHSLAVTPHSLFPSTLATTSLFKVSVNFPILNISYK